MGLKDVHVMHDERRGPHAELMIEQVPGVVHCPICQWPARVKERHVVHYVDLPVYGKPMSLARKKHRMGCVDPTCAMKSRVLEDHRIAAKNRLLTTRAAKWATDRVGRDRTVSEVAAELACDWNTVNDAVNTYGKALLETDCMPPNKTTAIVLDERPPSSRPEPTPHQLRRHGACHQPAGHCHYADGTTVVRDCCWQQHHHSINTAPTRLGPPDRRWQ